MPALPRDRASRPALSGAVALRVKRIYEEASPADGRRVLVDRVWPRGVSKERAGLDRWMAEVAPSHELRRWFGHDPARWKEFVRRYHEELDGKEEAVGELEALARAGHVTLLYAARDEAHNQAVALAAYLEARGR